MNEKKSPITWGEAGIIATIIATAVGATWAVSTVRAQDLQKISAIHAEDMQRITRLETIVENHAEEMRLQRETSEGVRRLLEVHLNDSTKPRP